MILRLITIIVLSVTVLSACAEQGGPITKQQVGTLLGGAGGAALGSQFGKGSGNVAMIAAGTLLGAALGNSLGASFDKNDMMYYNQTSQRTLESAPTGQTTTWKNPDSGNYGTITPTRTYQSEGKYCREYNQRIVVNGKSEQAMGRACRQQDGTWQIVE